MKQYKKGTKFTVCSFDDLLKKGWYSFIFGLNHDDFPDCSVTKTMIDEYEGETLTVDFVDSNLHRQKKWYHVNENTWVWPVATFLETVDDDHTCKDGMTPIDGWFICKTCGTNLRTVK